ncbi:MAG: tRNA lysidine(34) synthetase TilS [Gammaproteobacteria bacterium]|nr:tRNA lysidine(34) synthetase TilS [Gammaproteobacteria bacterium]
MTANSKSTNPVSVIHLKYCVTIMGSLDLSKKQGRTHEMLGLTAENILQVLNNTLTGATIKTWWLAYSGGVDSQVLLHLLSATDLDVRAVYIDHGLQIESPQWAEHCARSCQQLNIPFQSISVNAKAKTGESPEASARHARYQALATLVEENHCLLTAQHQDDQAETFLLQLFRGAGAAGLAAMPFCDDFSNGLHMRPLLAFTQDDILAYANQHELNWVEDPSNKDDRYDRNYLRNQIMPLLKQRWPAIDQTISGVAKQQAENKQLLEYYAAAELKHINADADSLPVDALLDFDEPHLRNVLRYWIKQQGIPVPSRKILQQIMQQMFTEKEDARSKVSWSGFEMYRHKGELIIVPGVEHDATQSFNWKAKDDLVIESLSKKLVMEKVTGKGLKEDVIGKDLRVCFRQGGEHIKPAGRKDNHRLKKLFQEAAVPAWQRSRIPLVYLGDDLIAVVGYWVADEYKVEKDEVGVEFILIESANERAQKERNNV